VTCGRRADEQAPPPDAARAQGAASADGSIVPLSPGSGVQGTPAGVPADFTALAKQVDQSVVAIRGKQIGSLGSGLAVSGRLVLTNAHVVAEAREVLVVTAAGDEREATVVGVDAPLDIALLRIDEEGDPLPAAPLGDSTTLAVGDWVVAVGHPFGLEHTVTAGIVSAKGRSARDLGAASFYQSFIQTDASINPGNSGGPLVDLGGRVVGINTAVDLRGAGIGYAIPIDMVKQVLPMLEKAGRVTRAWLGVGIAEVTPRLAAELGLDRPRGALITQVARGSPAARAGVRPGDVILAVSGREVDAEALPWLVSMSGIGTELLVQVFSGRSAREVRITTEALPD
jgi:serine protease Do